MRGTVEEVEEVDALVVGGGVAGLTAAWELARAGRHPLLVEARGYTGGLVAGGTVGGVELDLGAEAFVLRGDAVTSMVSELGLEVLAPAGGGARLFLPPLDRDAGTWALHRFPADSFLGIPARPLAADVVAVIGQEAAERAALDAELGGEVGVSDATPSDLASFVTARMGHGVLDRLVRPIVAGIHTSDPSVLDSDTVAPGLREDTGRLGSLAAAVAERRARQARAGTPRAVDVTTAGGLFRLPRALVPAIEAAGGQVLTRTGAQAIRPAGPPSTDLWEVDLAPTGRGATPSAEPVATGPARTVRTRRLVLACSAGAALRLLEGAPGVDTGLEVPVGSPIARLTLVVRAPELDRGPVGSGLLVAPPSDRNCPVQAKALSHLSVKWPWVGEAAVAAHGAGAQVLRLSYGRPGEPYPQVDLDRALADVAVLTGVEVAAADVLDSLLVRWDGTLPPFTPAYRARTRRLVTEAHSRPGLAVCGAWVAGAGIGATVTQARVQAVRLAEH